MRRPRVVIAGVGSGVGKTTVATGLMAALRARGMAVQGFKVGPDYIDPSYHTSATGRESRNLDTYLLGDRTMVDCFSRASSDAEISVVEGVMGLFDGMGGTSDRGSTASVAKLLRAPVILVVDVRNSARSAAASVLGFALFDRKVDVAGVVLNRAAGERHAETCIRAIRKSTRVPVLGWLPKEEGVRMPERHLGLVPSGEKGAEVRKTIERLGGFIEEHVDVDRVVRIADSAPPMARAEARPAPRSEPSVRIGVAMDEAFSFYYADAMDLLRRAGAAIVPFSPVRDPSPPEGLDGLYIGGGFPEVYSGQLEENASMRGSIRRLVEEGIPTLAECGGLMYLTRSITGFDGTTRSMVGVLDASTVMMRKLTIGYTLAHSVKDSILSRSGEWLRGHEFHYSGVEGVPQDASLAYVMERGKGISEGREGWQVYNALACYSHTHLCSRPRTARRFVEACVKYSRS